MIRVVGNLSWLVPGGVGGSEEYTVRLLRAVLADPPADIDLGIVASDALFGAYPELTAIERGRLHGPMHVRPFRIAVESTRLVGMTRGADVIHHFGGRVPARRANGAHVVTIHDLQPIHRPEHFSALKRHYLGWALPRSARRAAIVVTPSAWVARTVQAEFGIDGDRVRPVSSTWDEATEVDLTLADALGTAEVVLYPAVTHPHKNHLVLIEAVKRLAARRPTVRLVLTGAPGRAESEVAAACADAPVTRLGRVSSPQLRGLLERADVLAMPSRYEGFGLPVLEAMRARTPVVAARNGAVEEVLAQTGILVDPGDVDAWTDALDAALDGGGVDLEAAADRAAQYSPRAAAARLVEVWRTAARSSTDR